MFDSSFRVRCGNIVGLDANEESDAVPDIRRKVDPKTAQGILRHTDAALTMNIYTHAQDPAKRAALEKFEQRLVQ